MALREIKTAEVGPPRVLYYGPTGTGKTASLATLNKISTKGAVLATEERNLASYFQMAKWLGIEKPAPVFGAGSYAETKDTLFELAKLGLDWLAFDGISAASDTFLKELFPPGQKFGKSDAQSSWGILGGRIIEVAQIIRDGPWRFSVTTALPVRMETEDNLSELSILLDGKMGNKKVPPWMFNGIAYAERPTLGKDGLPVYKLSFFQNGNRDAKAQFVLSDEMLGVEDPDWYEIFKKAGRL